MWPKRNSQAPPAQAPDEQADLAEEAARIARAQGGDEEAVGALYDAHHTRVFRYLWSRLGDQRLAEDMSGDVFIRMVAALPRYRAGEVPFRGWLYRIAHGLLVDHYRKEAFRRSPAIQATATAAAAPQSAGEADPSEALERHLTADRLRRALVELEPARFPAPRSASTTAAARGSGRARRSRSTRWTPGGTGRG